MSEASVADRLDQLLAPFTPDKPGLAALVTVGGEAVFERYLGGADLEHGVPVTAATRFHVASVSKQFTAFAVLLEAAANRVDLEADIHAYLPELADYGATVTVLDLVHHTGGLRDQWELMMLSGTPLDGLIRQSAIVAMAARQKELNFPPGTDFRYSNTGYSLLAEIVARTSGKTFARYLEEAVFTPLGMRETLVYGDAARLLPDRAMSYRFNARGEVRLARLNYSNYGATSLHTTARDLAKWACELLHPSVFQPDLIATMTSPGALRDGTPLNYGFGIMREVLAGRPALTHGGGDAGYRAAFDCFPGDDASVIVLANGQADVGAIAQALADAFLSAAPRAPDPATPEAAVLAGLTGYYVGGWGPGLTLRATDGKLMVSGGGAPPLEAKFLPNGDFYLYGPSYRFSPRPGGSLAETQGVGGLQMLHRRANRTQPSAADLAALEGRYYSDEIDSTYDLAAVENGLTISCLRFPPLKLAPADLDAFDGPGTRLTVLRDEAGAPTGFTIATGRVRGLRFQKIH
jgi:CubicO group peptidase (beta-lactamase class C family)